MALDAFPILTSADLARTTAFYRDLLGWAEVYRFPAEGEPAYVTLARDGSRLGIGADTATAGHERDTGVFSLCVYVADVDATVAAARAAGAAVLSEPVEQPWGERMAEVADPDGVRVVLLA